MALFACLVMRKTFLPNNGLASAFLNKTWFEARSNILIETDRPGGWSPENDCCWRVAFRQPLRKPSSQSLHLSLALLEANGMSDFQSLAC